MNIHAGITRSPWSTLRFTARMPNWPPWWLVVFLLALGFAVGWAARGTLFQI